MQIVAHRGASAYALENSRSAFLLAWEQGADMIELDVHRTRDNELVIMHDDDLRTTTNGRGKIKSLSLAEVQRFQLNNGEPVPTFEQVYALSLNRGGMYIELKADGTERPLVERLSVAETQAEKIPNNKLIVGSFREKRIEKIKKIDKKIQTSLMVGPEKGTLQCTVPQTKAIISQAQAVGADFVHVCWEGCKRPSQLLTNDLLEAAEVAGLGVVVWHEERDEELLPIAQVPSLFGLCTNTPDRARHYLELAKRENSAKVNDA